MVQSAIVVNGYYSIIILYSMDIRVLSISVYAQDNMGSY